MEEYKVSKTMLIMTLEDFREGTVRMRQDERGQPAKQLMKLKVGLAINRVCVLCVEYIYIRDWAQIAVDS